MLPHHNGCERRRDSVSGAMSCQPTVVVSGYHGSENSRPNGGCQEHAPILSIHGHCEAGKGLKNGHGILKSKDGRIAAEFLEGARKGHSLSLGIGSRQFQTGEWR